MHCHFFLCLELPSEEIIVNDAGIPFISVAACFKFKKKKFHYYFISGSLLFSLGKMAFFFFFVFFMIIWSYRNKLFFLLILIILFGIVNNVYIYILYAYYITYTLQEWQLS